MVTFASGTLYYVAVTLKNNQAGATNAALQAKVTVNPSSYSTYEASDLSNINWQDGAGNILKSWRENGTSNGDTADVYWVLLTISIAGSGGTLIIYLCFYATATNKLNTTDTGEFPTATGTYGQYDDGAAVFDLYDNFTGASLSGTNWGTIGAGVTTNNYLSLAAGGGTAEWIYSKASFTPPVIAEAYVIGSQATIEAAAVMIEQSTTQTLSGGGIFLYNGYSLYTVSGDNSDMYSASSVGYAYVGTSAAGTFAAGVFSLDWYATSNEVATSYNGIVYNATDATYALPGSVYCSFGNYYNTITMQWARVRKDPPSQTMPAATFGSITPAGTAAAPTMSFISSQLTMKF